MIDLTRESPSPLKTSTPRRNLQRTPPEPIDLSPEALSVDITQFDMPGSHMSSPVRNIQALQSSSPPPVPKLPRMRPRVTFAPLVEERSFSSVDMKEKLAAPKPRSKDISHVGGKTGAGMGGMCLSLLLALSQAQRQLFCTRSIRVRAYEL